MKKFLGSGDWTVKVAVPKELVVGVAGEVGTVMKLERSAEVLQR